MADGSTIVPTCVLSQRSTKVIVNDAVEVVEASVITNVCNPANVMSLVFTVTVPAVLSNVIPVGNA